MDCGAQHLPRVRRCPLKTFRPSGCRSVKWSLISLITTRARSVYLRSHKIYRFVLCTEWYSCHNYISKSLLLCVMVPSILMWWWRLSLACILLFVYVYVTSYENVSLVLSRFTTLKLCTLVKFVLFSIKYVNRYTVCSALCTKHILHKPLTSFKSSLDQNEIMVRLGCAKTFGSTKKVLL